MTFLLFFYIFVALQKFFKEKLKTIMQLTPEQLTLMGDESRKLALQITPAKWADTVIQFL